MSIKLIFIFDADRIQTHPKVTYPRVTNHIIFDTRLLCEEKVDEAKVKSGRNPKYIYINQIQCK